MNLFEKIFNYQIISRLEDSGTFMVTSHERSWLKTMLQHPAAIDAFSPETLRKLQLILEQDDMIEIDEHLLQKAASRVTHIYHSSVRPLRQAITNKSVIRLSYGLKNGQTYTEQQGFPYKLEYSMVKKEWSLLWYHMRNRMLMSTKLMKIVEVREEGCPPDDYKQLLAEIDRLFEKRKVSAAIRVVSEYNGELSRILYAFSCFEKEVSYLAESNEYTIKLYFASNESEFVLSKTRFLGKRVCIVEGEHLRRRMLESATMALGRYNEQNSLK